MPAKNRPSLASLSDRLARKDPPAPAPAAEADPPPTPARSEPKERRVQVLVRMTPAERKALRRIALEGDTTVQALVEDAIRDVIRRHDG